MVAQREFKLVRGKEWQRKVMEIFLLRYPAQLARPLTLMCARRNKHAKNDVKHIINRTRDARTCSSNLKYSNCMALLDFRFKVTDVSKIENLVHLPGGVTKSRRYECDYITSCCIFLKILSSPCSWVYLEENFEWEVPNKVKFSGKPQKISLLQIFTLSLN